MVQLTRISEAFCNNVMTHVYDGAALVQREAKISWSELVKEYKWPTTKTSPNPEETIEAVTRIEMPLRPIFEKIKAGQQLEAKEVEKLPEFAREVMHWGKVEHPANLEKAENPQNTYDVIKSGLDWCIIHKDVPMNSAWTKIVAISSEFLEETGVDPHAIYDSRVAASMCTRLDQILSESRHSTGNRPAHYLPTNINGLGQLKTGRGGTRKEGRNYAFDWPIKQKNTSGTKSLWNAQFACTRLCNALKKELNANLGKYGKMPYSRVGNGTWTTRGVEMCLFMDGY